MQRVNSSFARHLTFSAKQRLSLQHPHQRRTPPVLNAMAKAAKGSPEKKVKAKKDPNAPKGASGAYIWFCQDKRAEVKEKHPEYTVANIGKALGEMWKATAEGDKKKYYEQAVKDKERYMKAKAEYEKKKGDADEEAE